MSDGTLNSTRFLLVEGLPSINEFNSSFPVIVFLVATLQYLLSSELKRAERVAQASAPGSCKLQCPLVTSSAGIIGLIMPADDVTSGHQHALQFAAATCDSLRDTLRCLKIYYAYTKITRQACSYRQNRRKDAERSMVQTGDKPKQHLQF